MELTIQVNPHERTVRLREVSSLAAGDVCSVTLDGVRGADLPSLRLALYRDAASASPVASCVSFSAVPGHPNLASGTLGLDTSEMAAWFDDVRPDGESSDDGGPSARTADAAERAARADGWLVVADRLRTWAACRVPAILRPGAGMSGVPSVDSLALLVEGLVAAAMADALAVKADKAVPAAAGSLASLDASGNLSDSGATPASIRAAAVAEVVANAPGTMDTLKEIADILGSAQQSGTVLRRISDLEGGKVDKEAGKGLFSGSYEDLSNKPTIPAPVSVDATLTTQGAAADAKAVGDALAGKLDGAAAYPVWNDSSFEGWWPPGTIVSWKGKLYRTEEGTAFPGEPGTSEGAAEWTEIAVQSLLAAKANASDVATALAQKANASDLPYAMVTQTTPTEWVFSGVEDWFEITNIEYSVESPQGWYLSVASVPQGWVNDTFASGPADATSLTFIVVDLNYVEPDTTVVATKTGYALLDRAVNKVVVTGDTTLALPALANAGKSRDFYLRMTVTGSRQVSFSPTSGMTYTGLGNPSKTYSAGTYLLRFTETSANEFCVADMLAQIPDVTGKADKVSGATAGNIAALNAQGNLADSGVKASDFAAKSDLPYRLVEPGEWEFSGVPSGATNVQMSFDDVDGWSLRFEIAGGSRNFSTGQGTAEDLVVVFETFGEYGDITATRASLPGHLLDRSVNLVNPTVTATTEWTWADGETGTPVFSNGYWTVQNASFAYDGPVAGSATDTEITFAKTDTKSFYFSSTDYDYDTGEQVFVFNVGGEGGEEVRAKCKWSDSYGENIVESIEYGGVEYALEYPATESSTGNTDSGTGTVAEHVVSLVATYGPTVTLTMPQAVPGRVRDLIARIDLSQAAGAPPVAFSGGSFEAVDGEMPELVEGVNLLSFTETTAGVFAVAYKEVQPIAQGGS